jgi:hypothetical protein
MSTPAGPVVEAKVKTSAAAAAAVGLVLSLLSAYVFKGGEVPDALAVMVTTVVTTVVSGGVTFLVGWLTKHTPRWLAKVDSTD